MCISNGLGSTYSPECCSETFSREDSWCYSHSVSHQQWCCRATRRSQVGRRNRDFRGSRRRPLRQHVCRCRVLWYGLGRHLLSACRWRPRRCVRRQRRCRLCQRSVIASLYLGSWSSVGEVREGRKQHYRYARSPTLCNRLWRQLLHRSIEIRWSQSNFCYWPWQDIGEVWVEKRCAHLGRQGWKHYHRSLRRHRWLVLHGRLGY